VVVPVLNEANRIERFLASLARTCPGAEVIVVDGGSTDGTSDLVRRCPHVMLFEAARGRARQMNAGARIASGSALLFLHADTTLPLGAQGAIQDALRSPGVVGGRFDVRFDNPRPIFKLIATMMDVRSRLSGICTGDQALFVRRSAYDALGGYSDIPLMEDLDFSRRLKRHGRVACLRLRVTTAAKGREGVLRMIALWWTLRLLYAVGIPPARLYRWYYGGHADASAGARRSPQFRRPPRRQHTEMSPAHDRTRPSPGRHCA
jgi:rSAM/selenodomain-associated transferase 2